MFVALRDLRHARGRFALVATVVVMVALLVTFLSMLTAGLARASTSAITDLPADHLAFTTSEAGAAPDVTSSRVTEAEWEGWAERPGVTAAEPLGIATTRATAGTTAAVTAFGVEPGSSLAPAGLAEGEVVLTPGAADALGIDVGDELTLDGEAFLVGALAEADLEYSHTPVVWMSLADWQAVGARGAPDGGPVATVVALTTDPSADLAAADAAIGTTTVTTHDARAAVSSFTAENTSLTTMQGFLMAISALVVGAFFTVWTIGRQGDIAVLKALGAPTGYLLRDAVGQAALLLVGGVALGAAIAGGAATLLGGAIPVLVSPATTLVPAAALVLLGLLGAGAAVMRITRTDPHAALASR